MSDKLNETSDQPKPKKYPRVFLFLVIGIIPSLTALFLFPNSRFSDDNHLMNVLVFVDGSCSLVAAFGLASLLVEKIVFRFLITLPFIVGFFYLI